MLINRQEAVFLYADSAVAWANNNFTTNATLGTYLFTNMTNNSWNVFPVLLPDITGKFYNLTKNGADVNITACSLYNHTANLYVPWFNNDDLNNESSLKMGMALWCEFNSSYQNYTYTRKI